jgi:hypothetical protein
MLVPDGMQFVVRHMLHGDQGVISPGHGQQDLVQLALSYILRLAKCDAGRDLRVSDGCFVPVVRAAICASGQARLGRTL